MVKFLKMLVAGILAGAFPLCVSALDGSAKEKSSLNVNSNAILVVDSLPVIKKQEDKDPKQQKEKGKKPSNTEKAKEPQQKPKVEGKRPDIKAVPKARPKLRPGTVTDRIKVKRPPVKVRPGKGLRSMGL